MGFVEMRKSEIVCHSFTLVKLTWHPATTQNTLGAGAQYRPTSKFPQGQEDFLTPFPGTPRVFLHADFFLPELEPFLWSSVTVPFLGLKVAGFI